MSRFDDFLKLLLGLLVTQVVRDHQKVSDNLVCVLGNSPDRFGLSVLDTLCVVMFPYVLLFLFLRNTHASILWDRWLRGPNNQRVRESSRSDEVIDFVVTCATFVVAPLVAIHFFTGKQETLLEWFWVAIVAIYAVFLFHLGLDFRLFFKSENAATDRPVEKAIVNWFRLDLIAVAAGACYLYHWDSAGTDPRMLLTGVSGLILVTVVIDYCLNNEFYFPASRYRV